MTATSAIRKPEPTALLTGSRPYVRWWWLSGPFRPADIDTQLTWLRDHGFGGVELAWLWPAWLERSHELLPGPDWLGEEWSALVAHTKQTATRLGLGCDFTLGSCWPFAGSCVGPEHAAQSFTGPSNQQVHCTWESTAGATVRVVDHLSGAALRAYAGAMLPALREALAGPTSSLFCDSLELRAATIWHPRLWQEFADRFGYRLEPFALELHQHPDIRFDYRSLIADTMLREFFETFTAICHEAGARARVQCHGAPTDLLAAYATVDVPESEAVLFPPHFSRIAASAAALTDRSLVTCESFTCIYGFPAHGAVDPRLYERREQLTDLKLVADAVFAHGVNQIIWHGMPYNTPGGRNAFYASVHVGPDAHFAAQLPAFNAYLAQVSSWLQGGRTNSRLAVYLPLEDNWMLDRIPEAERLPGANYRWELRHVTPPGDCEGFHPLWVSVPFLQRAEVRDQHLGIGPQEFGALLVDSEYVTCQALREFLRLAEAGLPVILRRIPREPGHRPTDEFRQLLDRLTRRTNVVAEIHQIPVRPLVDGDALPPFWSRRGADESWFFFAHPATRDVHYPLRYGQGSEAGAASRQVVLDLPSGPVTVPLQFDPHQSLLVRASNAGKIEFVDIRWQAP